MSTLPCRLVVLISGTGSTLVNLHDQILQGAVPADIVLVVSSRKNAMGLERANERGIPQRVLRRRPFVRDGRFDTDAYARALVEIVEPFEPHLAVTAGFMTKLGTPFLNKYDTVNVHPALLPVFGGEGYYGHHVHQAVLEAGVKITGATVHFADSEYDHGPIIMQEAVPVLEDDTPDALAQRVQAAERRIYPQAITLYAKGLIARQGRRVRILPEPRMP